MVTGPDWLTVREMANETGWPASTVRWHCREEQGMLHGVARKSDAGYLIPAVMAPDLKRARQEFETWQGRGAS